MENNKCAFYTNNFCSAIAVRRCPYDCKFYKTQEQYDKDVENAAKTLKEKGLRPVVKQHKGGLVMSVEKIEK